jgi:phosphoribosylaminoimidazolecarboxamide formyltransferase/IMP cyclohydrolase
MKKIRRAIVSVTDKSGIVDFSRALSKMGVEIVSTGGTADVKDGGGNCLNRRHGRAP